MFIPLKAPLNIVAGLLETPRESSSHAKSQCGSETADLTQAPLHSGVLQIIVTCFIFFFFFLNYHCPFDTGANSSRDSTESQELLKFRRT